MGVGGGGGGRGSIFWLTFALGICAFAEVQGSCLKGTRINLFLIFKGPDGSCYLLIKFRYHVFLQHLPDLEGVFRIRIHYMRIRIQAFRRMQIRIQFRIQIQA
jgi:hypothetical protein